jgi:glycosyltransferase involved in cell wall biosynthesis
MNTAETLDPERFHFDIFCVHDWDNGFDDVISRLGGRRFTVFQGCKPNLLVRLFRGSTAFKKILKKSHYDVVHINTMNGVGFVYAWIAKRQGVSVRIVHSHNSAYGSGSAKIKGFAHMVGKKLFGRFATNRLACSTQAGRYLFDNEDFSLIRNGTDVDRFAYDSKSRSVVRRNLDIPTNALVFGSLGRLELAKNPSFQLEVLNRLHEEGYTDSYLLLVGSGSLSEVIRHRAFTEGLSDYVRLPGGTNSPEAFLSALDVFSLPSVYEGFPMVVVEAIDSGLPVLYSDSMQLDEVSQTGMTSAQALDPSAWADRILELWKEARTTERRHGQEIVEEIGFDRRDTTQTLEILYQGLAK